MLNVDAFLTALYVMVDDFCHSHASKRCPGPDASLSPSEVITLAIFARWSRFSSERDFYRYASGHLTEAFPNLPDRCVSQLNSKSFCERFDRGASRQRWCWHMGGHGRRIGTDELWDRGDCVSAAQLYLVVGFFLFRREGRNLCR
jgi:hypothetical protein